MMGLTLGQTNGDVFAAVEGCSMLFPCQGSHPPETRCSTRSRHAKWHLLFPVSALVMQLLPPSLCWEAGAATVRHCLSQVTQPWGFPPVLPAPPLAVATPPPHCTSGEQNHPRSCPRFIPRHMVEKQGSAAEREDDGTAGKVEGQASETSLPPAAQGIRHLLIFYRKPGNIHMEISHFQSIRGVAQGFSQLCFTSCRSYCFPLFHCTMRET